jgi:isocitrate/isopropylmalate dehydrogenase
MIEVADRVRNALREVVVEKGILTRDLGGSASTTEFTDQIVRAIEAPGSVPAVP